jgi:thioredoxin reductase
MTSHITDVLILGSGPAGFSAALALSRMLIPTTIFTTITYRNNPTNYMHNVLGFDHAAPSDFRAAGRRDLTTRYSTNKFVERNIDTLKKREDGLFEATDGSGKIWVGKKVVLATGVKDLLPSIEGYEECWGKSIFHCLFCHGFEERSAKKVGVLAEGFLSNSQFSLPISGMAGRLAEEVVILTNGDEGMKEALEVAIKGSVLKTTVDSRRVSKVENLKEEDGVRIRMWFEDGSKEDLGFLAHTPNVEANVPKAWIEELGLKMTAQGNLEVSQPFGETSCPGIFAAGDVSSMIKAVAPAMSAGTMAGAGVVHQLVMGK